MKRATEPMRIAADYLFTGEENPSPGRLVIENGSIAEILPPGESDLDLGAVILSSGLVNSHVHLDLSLERDSDTIPGSFEDWLKGVVEARRKLGDRGLVEAAVTGIEESLSNGTTAVFDIDPRGHSCEALRDSDLKRVLFREVISLEAELSEDKTPAEIIDDFVGETSDPSRELRALSPHSPYTVHPNVMTELMKCCEEKKLLWATHVAEAEWEQELLTEGTGAGAEFLKKFGADPIDWNLGNSWISDLDVKGALSSSGLIIHGNHCSGDEFRQIAENNLALVWCPSSHDYFRRPAHPAPEAIKMGVDVLLGTDGRISAGHLSMLEEMRSARIAAPQISALDLWRMVTIHPRSWLARNGHGSFLGSGRLQPGDPADLVAVSIPGNSEANESPLEAALQGSVQACWIDGRVINSSAPDSNIDSGREEDR